MYLKVNDGEKDYYYSFDEGKDITIGRGSSNSIKLVCDGVSRTHVEIKSEKGDYYVVDKGATNGTFINDEKLEKDIKVPFNTFFPVLLGAHAKVFLLDESDLASLDELVKNTKELLAAQD
jgi:pSer/pThr/pTyr-binding forkhead associated (FHA) protein